jgi:lipoprotein signal peptidase
MNGELKTVESKKSERIFFSLFWFIVFLFLLAFDQVTKNLAFAYFDFTASAKFLDFTLFKNYHFAFSVPLPTFVMYAVYSILISIIIAHVYSVWHRTPRVVKFAWVLVLAGAFSNVGERIVTGYVKDFIKLHTGFFNLADVYIFVGAAMVLVFSSPRLVKAKERG